MKRSAFTRSVSLCALFTCLAALSSSLTAQTRIETYDLQNVFLDNGGQITGTFQWTYTLGDFENGSGQFLNYSIPGWGPTAPPTQATIEAEAIEFTMVGNYHNYGLDITLRFAAPLSPGVSSSLDLVRSKWQIEVGVPRSGLFVSGMAVSECVPPQSYGTGTAGSGGFVPNLTHSGGDPFVGNSSFGVDGDQLLGGTVGLLLMGFDQIQAPVLGITLLVDPTAWVTTPVVVSGAPGVPGAGTLNVPLPVPSDPTLAGMEVNFQLGVLDPGGPAGVAATNGLATILCH